MLVVLVRNNKSISIEKVLMSYFICIFFMILYGGEYALGNIELFTSDEAHYVYVANNKLFDINDNRFLWYVLNYLILNYDIAGVFFLKVINIPILISTLVLIAKIFKSNKIFNSLFFLPYLAFLTVYNMRDITILLIIVISVCNFYNKKYIKMVIASVILFLLRPQYVFVIYGVIILVKAIRMKKNNGLKWMFGFRKNTTFPLILLLIILMIASNYSRISTVVEKNLVAIERHIDNEAEFVSRMERTGATGNIKKDLPISMLKYTLSPLPTSLFERIINGGYSQWSLTDDIIRFINQCGYYLLLSYLAINCKYIKRILSNFDDLQLSIILILFSYMPIYSFYLYGVMHQRLRLPFQIMIFMIAIEIWNYKSIKSKSR